MKRHEREGKISKNKIKGAALLLGICEYVLSAYIDPLGLGKTSV